jgi:hypothetical protein
MNKNLLLSLILCAAATTHAQDPSSSSAKVDNGSATVRAFIDDEGRECWLVSSHRLLSIAMSLLSQQTLRE